MPSTLPSDILERATSPSGEPYSSGDWTLSPSIEGKVSRVFFVESGERKYCLKIAQIGEEDFFLGDIDRIRGLALILPHISTVLDTGILPDGRAYCVQTYIPGTPLDIFQGSLNAKSLAQELALIHEHAPTSTSWGYPVSGDVTRGKHASLEEVIYKKDIEPMQQSENLTPSEKQELTDAIITHFQRLSHVQLPCMVHGDCHEGNILVDEDGMMRLIDFGNIAYFTPEYDFARMQTQTYFRENPDILTTIRENYENITGRKLDEIYMQLFYITRLAYCLRKPRSPEDVERCWKLMRNI